MIQQKIFKRIFYDSLMSENLLQIDREKNLRKVEALNQITSQLIFTKTVSLKSTYTCPLKSQHLG